MAKHIMGSGNIQCGPVTVTGNAKRVITATGNIHVQAMPATVLGSGTVTPKDKPPNVDGPQLREWFSADAGWKAYRWTSIVEALGKLSDCFRVHRGITAGAVLVLAVAGVSALLL